MQKTKRQCEMTIKRQTTEVDVRMTHLMRWEETLFIPALTRLLALTVGGWMKFLTENHFRTKISLTRMTSHTNYSTNRQ